MTVGGAGGDRLFHTESIRIMELKGSRTEDLQPEMNRGCSHSGFHILDERERELHLLSLLLGHLHLLMDHMGDDGFIQCHFCLARFKKGQGNRIKIPPSFCILQCGDDIFVTYNNRRRKQVEQCVCKKSYKFSRIVACVIDF